MNNSIGYRPTWAEVDLDNIRHNFRQIKKHLAPLTKTMVTVKADAYGHGLVPVAKTLCKAGVDYLGVASIDEGIVLRKAGITCPLLILGVVLPESHAPLWAYRLTPTVCTLACAQQLSREAKQRRSSISVHLKVDTGMGRIGVAYTEAAALARKIYALPGINLEGIFTHLALADASPRFTQKQLARFSHLIFSLQSQGISVPLIHAANSMGVIGFKESHFTLVRPGLAVYGLHPRKNLRISLKPALSLKTKIIFIKRVPAGTGISYGHTYVTKRKTSIVTVPIGYGDGYPRNLSNCAPVLIKGKRFMISGRVCMDQIMVDVHNTSVSVGDSVVLIGAQGKLRITAEELAERAGTIPYEIVCGIGGRVPRIYKG